MIDRPVFITGCARSGTSLTAGIINLCGAWGGELTGATRYNKRGQFENVFIRQQITKPYLARLGVDPMGQWPLPDLPAMIPRLTADAPWLRQQMLDVLAAQGYPGGRWFYKGAKMCLLWPLYAVAFPDAEWVVVRRDDEEIVRSCLRTGFMRAFDAAEGWHQWVQVHHRRFGEMRAVGLKINEIWPVKIVHGDFSEIRALIQQLGLNWNKPRVVDFVSPALWSGAKPVS